MDILLCTTCGKSINGSRDAVVVVSPISNDKIYFCKQSHFDVFMYVVLHRGEVFDLHETMQ